MADPKPKQLPLEPNVQAMLDQAKALSRDGSKIIEELSPDLPWEKMANLAGERILIMEVEKGYSQFSEDAMRVTFAKEDDSVMRITSIYAVVNRKLEKIENKLPLWVNVVKRESTSGNEYYDLE